MIIGLTGYARSGKDTVANILVENYGYTRIAFADKIKELLYELDPQVGSTRLKALVSEYGWEVAKSSPEVRHLLQDLGVGARNVLGENFWVQQALKDVHFEGNYVITDVRFTNEADIVKKYDNSQLWRIKRLGVGAVNGHVSESDLDGYPVDQIFINNGTVGDLESLIKTRMAGYAKSA